MCLRVLDINTLSTVCESIWLNCFEGMRQGSSSGMDIDDDVAHNGLCCCFAVCCVTCVSLVCCSLLLVVAAVLSLNRARKENIKLSTLFKQRYNVNVLSAARFFLFGR